MRREREKWPARACGEVYRQPRFTPRAACHFVLITLGVPGSHSPVLNQP